MDILGAFQEEEIKIFACNILFFVTLSTSYYNKSYLCVATCSFMYVYFEWHEFMGFCCVGLAGKFIRLVHDTAVTMGYTGP